MTKITSRSWSNFYLSHSKPSPVVVYDTSGALKRVEQWHGKRITRRRWIKKNLKQVGVPRQGYGIPAQPGHEARQ